MVEHENEHPKQNTDSPAEHYLSSFLKRARQKHKKGALDEEEAKVLCTLPSWSLTPQTEVWKAMHDSARDLLQRRQTSILGSSQTPRYPSKSSLMAHDRKIGQWLAHQRQDYTDSKKNSTERATLLQNLPVWSCFLKQGRSSKEHL